MKKKQRAFTLIELLITVVVTSISLLMFGGILINAFRVRSLSAANLTLQKNVFTILSQLTFDIRWSQGLTVNSTGSPPTESYTLTMDTVPEGGWGAVPVEYQFDPTNHTLTRQENAGITAQMNSSEATITQFTITPNNATDPTQLTIRIHVQHRDNPQLQYEDSQVISIRRY